MSKLLVRKVVGAGHVRNPHRKPEGWDYRTWGLVALLIVLAIVLAKQSFGAGLDDCYRATCRVEMGNGSGSGCVFHADAERFYILTNAHVAGTARGRNASVVFTREGYEGTIPAVVEYGQQGEHTPDVAVLSVMRSSMAGYEPPVIPLALRDPQAGDTVLSVGAARGAWATAWTGHVTTNDGDTIGFLPTPAPGRSGSALFDATGSAIVGLVTWQTPQGGRAQSITAVRRVIDSRGVQTPPDVLAPLVPIRPAQQEDCPTCPQYRVPSSGNPWGNRPRIIPPECKPPNVTPPATKPTQPPVASAPACECKPQQPCQCDPNAIAKLAEDIAGIRDELASVNEAIVAINARPLEPTPSEPPVTRPDVPPLDKPAEVHHYVVVADLSAPGWPRVAAEVEQARDIFPLIHVVDAKDVPFVVRPLPQCVTYDSAGKPTAIAKGERETSLTLQRIIRRE